MSNITRQENRPSTYSVSKLRTYHVCSTLYKYKYVDKIRDTSLSKATLIGSCLHQALEDNYQPFVNIDNPPNIIPVQTVLNACNQVLSKVFVHDLDNQINEVYKYYKAIEDLYYRASSDYVGNSPIRKADGSVADAPEMTGTWKKEIVKLGLNEVQQPINNYIKESDIRWQNIDFFDLVLTVLKISSKFILDPRIKKILGVELAFSPETNVMVTPNTGEEGPILEAYIDLVAELDNGEVAIIDYKSGSQEYKEVDIVCNDQLLMYNYAYEQLSKSQPKYIGVYNLRANKLILTEVILAFREQVINHLTNVHKDIVAEKYEKRIPNKQLTNSSPCLDQFHKPCPFLGLCYPTLVDKME